MPKTGSGKTGERFAAEYLRRKGFAIVTTNFRCRFGEIDIIAQNDRYILFVEVKTREVDSAGHPLEAITPGKQMRIVKTAQFYLQSHPTTHQPRFDAAAVFVRAGEPVRIEYLENVFL